MCFHINFSDTNSGSLVLDEGNAGTENVILEDRHTENQEIIIPPKTEQQDGDTSDTSFEILMQPQEKNELQHKSTEEIFTPAHDNFFHVKPSASASSLSNVITKMIDGDSSLAIAGNAGVQLDTQTDNMSFMQGETHSIQSDPSFASNDYPLSMDDATFIVNNTYENNYESSQNELAYAGGSTFKTSAMHTQAAEEQSVDKSIIDNYTFKETNIQERTDRLTNVSSFKHSAVLQHSESSEE